VIAFLLVKCTPTKFEDLLWSRVLKLKLTALGWIYTMLNFLTQGGNDNSITIPSIFVDSETGAALRRAPHNTTALLTRDSFPEWLASVSSSVWLIFQCFDRCNLPFCFATRVSG
jgi:hypothetical protein